MPLDLSDDMDIFDGLETVSFQRPNLSGGGVTTYTGVTAFREMRDGRLIAIGDGQQMIDSAVYHLKSTTLAVVPRRGDRVVSASYGTWEVLSSNTETLTSRYECLCKKVSS